jgi:hypothetical protein
MSYKLGVMNIKAKRHCEEYNDEAISALKDCHIILFLAMTGIRPVILQNLADEPVNNGKY